MSELSNKFTKITGINEPYASEILKDNAHAVWHIPSGAAKTDRQSIIDEINGDEDLKVLFKINATPEDCTVTINEQVVSELKVMPGTEVSWKVEKENYTTQEGTETVNEATTKDINLVPVQVSFTINATPEGCKVTINDEERTSVTIDKGTEVSWKVEKENYTTQEDSETVNEDTTKQITLQPVQVSFTINPTPEDSTVTINSETRKTITVNKGTEVSWKVEKDTYTPQEGTETVNEDTTKDITLELAAGPASLDENSSSIEIS